MNKHVSKSAFKTQGLELLNRVQETGEPLIVTDHGGPVVEIRAVPKRKQNPRALLRGSVLYYERPTDPVGEEDWEALAETE